jgi:predicted RNase H-like HicB family nuclease
MSEPENPRFRIALYRARGGYFAWVTNLPGCYTHGATEVEAVERARAAIRSYLCTVQALAADRATLELEIRA